MFRVGERVRAIGSPTVGVVEDVGERRARVRWPDCTSSRSISCLESAEPQAGELPAHIAAISITAEAPSVSPTFLEIVERGSAGEMVEVDVAGFVTGWERIYDRNRRDGAPRRNILTVIPKDGVSPSFTVDAEFVKAHRHAGERTCTESEMDKMIGVVLTQAKGQWDESVATLRTDLRAATERANRLGDECGNLKRLADAERAQGDRLLAEGADFRSRIRVLERQLKESREQVRLLGARPL